MGAGEASDLDAAVASARAGDESGFAAVWRELHPPLLRYLTVRGDAGPEDLAAETWMHVVRGLSGFEGGGAEFRAWLFTIARHRAVDQGRARARRPRTVGVPDPAEISSPDLSPSAEQDAMDNEATARALRLVASLPPVQAEMVMLRVVAGLEVAEVARLLGKRPGTVRVTVHRALRTLADHPPLQAEMVMLRVVAGLDVADVARLVGKKPGTVRVTVHRALRTLAEHPHVRSARKAV